ncbi:membrane protein [Streptococcus dysgalactiae subsp. equisimilis 167]|nr:membrane protein [Streptococcus dysgalactiae subsp. equisimilis 167]
MHISLQLILIVVAFLTTLFMIDSIRKSKILIEDSFFWLFFSLIILLLSIFPGMAVFFSDLLGFESPANFVFYLLYFC